MEIEMSESYVIMDLDGYVKEMRSAAADDIASSNDDDLNQYISLQQMKNLVEEWSLGFDNQGRLIIDEDANHHIYEDTKTWITNVGLAKLAAAGAIECAWDNNCNDMVFWVKNKEPNNERKSKSEN
jgi:hypothetical protein